MMTLHAVSVVEADGDMATVLLEVKDENGQVSQFTYKGHFYYLMRSQSAGDLTVNISVTSAQSEPPSRPNPLL